VIFARNAARKVIAEKGAGIRGTSIGRDHLRIGGRRCKNRDKEKRPPRPFAQSPGLRLHHVVGSAIHRPNFWFVLSPGQGYELFPTLPNHKAFEG
jgi:hypothetical protein